MRSRRLLWPLASLLLALCSCNRSDSGQGAGGSASSGTKPAVAKRGVIGLSVLTLTNPFFKVIGDSLAEEAAKQGYEVSVVSGEFDPARQQNQVKDFIVRKVSAIVLTPCDSKAIGPAIEEATGAGIPVFTADIACLAPGAKIVCHVATDNLGGGREAGKGMIEALGDSGGKVAILDHKMVESCILRVQGFKEVIDDYNRGRASGKIEVVSELPSGGVKDVSFKATEDLLQAHPDLAGIFAINDPAALGARAAMEKAGKNLKLIGFDGQPEGKQAIKDGKIFADPVQFPDRIGVETARAIFKHFAGEAVPAQILIPTALYRKADGEKDPSLK